ncbi:MAG: hypothetical protein QMD82_08295 [bacterium]|nr:hypothetical protein [bacterium]
MKIADVVKLRDEVIKGDIHGWDSLRGIFEHGKEESPQYIFGSTYPSVEILNLLEAIDGKLKGSKKAGFFEIMGGYGTGKSRILCLLYHLFKNPGIGKKWLKENKIGLDLPEGATVLAFSLMDYPPNYLWEPIFQGLGREDLLKKVTIFPGSGLLKKAVADKGVTIIIMDEVESWYKGVKDKDNNLNFLQVLAEVACEEKPKLLVFCALYGEVGEVLARIDRVEPYRANLTLSKDRHKIISFRLFEDVDKKAASKIASTYLKHYHDAEVEILNPPSYEHRMAELYPIHPELIDALLTRYSSSPNYQNTRGVLCLLASVVAKKCQDIDLLLTSDIDMSEGDLLSLDRILVENTQKDAEAIEKDTVRSLLNTILLYSFGEGRSAGASRNDVVLGTLRPGMNINDIDSVLLDLPNIAPHVWIRDSKYVIGYEANIVTLIQNKALETVDRGKIKDALDIIKARLRKDLSYLIYHPDKELRDDIEETDTDRIRIAVSLKTLNQSEINEFYKGKKFANRLILYIPKSEDITKNEDLLVVAERLRLCDQYENEVSGENKTLLDKLRNRDSRSLREKISEIYGYWVKVTGFEDGEIKYRLVPCNLDEVRSNVKASYDVETIRGEILKHLEGKNNGLRLEDIKYDFKATPGKPIIVVEALLEEALRSLYGQDKIVIEYKGKRMRKPDPLPSFNDDMKVILSKYVPSPEEFIEEEKVAERKTEEVIKKIPKALEEFIEPKSEEIIEKEEERKAPSQTIETSEHSSPFSLSVEVERKVPDGMQIKGIALEFSGGSFDDFKSFNTFVNSLNIRKPKVPDVKLKLVIEGPMSKKEVIELIDKLPRSLGRGIVKAVVEAEKIA